ncbi:MAG: RtcB family protein [Armatimonadetes bacterium]|nr:RtcB family protein [Candidatus Hippobium faecium]
MFEIQGQYNTAKIFTDNIDNEAITSIYEFLRLECLKDSKIRIMPDTCVSKTAVVGTVITIDDFVVPGLIGADIGCGMLVAKLNVKEIDGTKLDNVIREYIPNGFRIREKAISKSNVGEILAESDTETAYKSLGTLGGGNHFIEVDKDDEDNLYLVIHSGSRNLGKEVFTYYHEIAKKTASDFRVPKNIAPLTGKDYENYIHDMKLTQEHADINRQTMLKEILYHMNWKAENVFDCIHNYIDTEKKILRKGAISAEKGEKVIIPMNMRDGSLICVGKGNEDWICSGPHGAGRIMSRSQAKELISMEEYAKAMEGIFTTSVKATTIDEAPQVYKNMYEIMENIKDTVSIEKIIKPVYNFKAN